MKRVTYNAQYYLKEGGMYLGGHSDNSLTKLRNIVKGKETWAGISMDKITVRINRSEWSDERDLDNRWVDTLLETIHHDTEHRIIITKEVLK